MWQQLFCHGESYYSKNLVMVNMRVTIMLEWMNILVYQHLPESKLSLWMSYRVRSFTIATIQYLIMILVFWPVERFLLELKESLLIGAFHRRHCNYSTGLVINKIFVRNLFVFNSSRIVLIEWTFYFVIFNCVGTTFRGNGIMQFTFVLVMRSNITWLVFQSFL